MKNLVHLFLAATLCFSIIFWNISCKTEKAPAEAIATFVMGDVKLLRQNEPSRPVKHGDKMASKDIIKIGKNSLFAFQVGESAVISVASDTTVMLADLLADKSNKLVLNRGKVLGSVKKLMKNSVYEVRTPTMVAAIRGTEFSVSYDEKKSVVAVKEGAVNVRRVDPKGTEAEEKTVNGGSTALITKTESRIRPINKEEKNEFVKVEKIKIIKDVHGKSESDLKEIEREILDEKTAKKAGKPESVKVRENAVATETNASETSGDTVLRTNKKVYKTEDTVTVSFKNMPDSKYCWISVAKAGTAGGDYVRYNWTYGKTEGEIVFEELGLEPGDYEARAHFSRKKDISKSVNFKVK